MFKGILPPRRVPSADFTVITNLVDGQGKENLPQPATTKTKQRSVSKGFGLSSEKKKKSVSKKSKDIQMPDTPVSGEAFDKLLVS